MPAGEINRGGGGGGGGGAYSSGETLLLIAGQGKVSSEKFSRGEREGEREEKSGTGKEAKIQCFLSKRALQGFFYYSSRVRLLFCLIYGTWGAAVSFLSHNTWFWGFHLTPGTVFAPHSLPPSPAGRVLRGSPIAPTSSIPFLLAVARAVPAAGQYIILTNVRHITWNILNLIFIPGAAGCRITWRFTTV